MEMVDFKVKKIEYLLEVEFKGSSNEEKLKFIEEYWVESEKQKELIFEEDCKF